ncbi:Cof-type HAD-IIB family hydrolase [Clostridium sp. SHJSY1]|uniref:Cof-type HAD-IIB family hydrolase n=1 Tax=Clostridium sp. SHJSY1 TaxID=2942483 RepID=UPI002874EA21|nr:Cof-type HAD-IIB family hydrolase [Clostridium sp. SHJSY1]MDS0525381.1 Cof-type HAD-IIB family hydrolase [Clostridium sp. SHJSY1]
MIKIIASDMDGTLLNSNHEISKENLEAIKKAQELGVHFTISTGRDIDGVLPVIKGYGLKCECILSNGAEYRDENGNILEKIDIEKSTVKKVIGMMNEAGIRAQIFTDRGIFTADSKEDALKGMAYMAQSFQKIESFEEALELSRNQEHFKKLKYIENLEVFLETSVEIRKIFAFYNDTNVIRDMKFKLDEIEDLAVSSSFRDNIEITNKDAQKGIILAKVAKKMGVSKDEVMVIGDSFNDYTMFTEFTESYAMENAIDEIKEIAKYITDTNNNAGVAKAIYKALGLN